MAITTQNSAWAPSVATNPEQAKNSREYLHEAMGSLTMTINTWFKQTDTIITLALYLQPGAKHNEIVGIHDDALKIKLTTSPIEGRANKALLQFLAKLFQVPISHVVLKHGNKSRRKIVEISQSHVDPISILVK